MAVKTVKEVKKVANKEVKEPAKKGKKKNVELVEPPVVVVPEEPKRTIDDIDFYIRRQPKFDESKDVYISTHENKLGKQLTVLLRNNMAKLFDGYVMIGRLDNRIYFKNATSLNGYHLGYRHGNSYGFNIALHTAEEVSFFKQFSKRDFHLNYDDELMLHYIEL